MSYIIYKRNTIGTVAPKVAEERPFVYKEYNGETVELGEQSGWQSLPFTSYEAVGKVFDEETGLNLIANNGAMTEIYLQFDEKNAIPTELSINNVTYTNNGYIFHVNNLSISADSEIKIRFTKINIDNGIVKLIGISKDLIEKIDNTKILNIECNNECDELSFTIPVGYANILVKESAVQNLKENDEVNIYFDKELVDRYYIKEIKYMKDNQFNIYCEDIIGIFETIDGGTVQLRVGESIDTEYDTNPLYIEILRRYCDGIMNSRYLYRMYREWSGKTIRENIQQFVIGQNSILSRISEFNRDTIIIDTNRSADEFGITTISKYDIYNDLFIEEIETIKEISIITDYGGIEETYVKTFDSPNAKKKYEIKKGKILLNGTETLGEYAIENYLTKIENSFAQSGKQLKFTARLKSASDIQKIRAGSTIDVETIDYGTLTGFIKSMNYILTNTATAHITMSLSQATQL